MNITAAMVKELRQRTGSPMMDCKKSLQAAEGDMEKAISDMRKAGLAKAQKKSGRTTCEGAIALQTSTDGKTVAMVEVNSETDFVVKSDDFQKFTADIATALCGDAASDNLDDLHLSCGNSVEIARQALVAKVGENISVRRFAKYYGVAGGTACYLHGGKIAVIVETAQQDTELGKDLAMHIAASNPECVSASEVPADIIQKEKEIFAAQEEREAKTAVENSKKPKPPEIVEKIINGKTNKFLQTITLEGQAFIKDDKTTVGKLLQSKNNKVIRFTRFEVGEGIQKEQVDFAQEVQDQLNA